MIAFTSAKSRLMMPGTVMMSEIPCTACRKISSAMRNASKKLVPRSTVSIKRSLGITMTVSTTPIRSCSACSACIMRCLPSNANGLVTTATLSAPSSLASEATTGAAPLPVPPPRPEVMKIMSAPSSASIIFSVSSSAALRPVSGFAPAPNPLVSFAPSCNLVGACESRSACKSVLAVMNSTPSTLARIMRLTALHPPPPTPITFIFAGCSSSLKRMRIPASFAVMRSSTFLNPCGPHVAYAVRAGSRGAGEHGFQFGHHISRALRLSAARFCCVHHQTNYRCIFRLSYLLRQINQTFGLRGAYWQMERIFGDFHQPVQPRSPAGENETSGNLRKHSGALQIIADQRQQFRSARFNDVGEHARKHRARRPVAHAGNFDGGIFVQQRSGRAAMTMLDAFGFWNRRAQTNRKIVGEMIATHRNRAGVANHTAAVDDEFGGAAADVEQAAAHVAFILRQARFRRSQRLEHRIANQNSRFVRGGNQVLRSRHRGGNQMHVGFQALADHADRVANAVLRVDDKFVRQNVQHFAVFGKRNVAGSVDGAAHIVALDIAGAIA